MWSTHVSQQELGHRTPHPEGSGWAGLVRAWVHTPWALGRQGEWRPLLRARRTPQEDSTEVRTSP